MSNTPPLTVVARDDLDPHYAATVLADSISDAGIRLTTFRLIYPRFIHSEMMTHRVFSRNAASSRAIPTETLIEMIESDTGFFMPATFNRRVTGMGVGEPLEGAELEHARETWRKAAASAVASARELLHTDKSRANRMLEPYQWYEAIFTGTEWDNFLGLRDHEAAQPEIQAIARCIRRALAQSTPQLLEEGMWHLPLVTTDEVKRLCDLRADLEKKMDPWPAAAGSTSEVDALSDEIDAYVEELKLISASRCARVSYARNDAEPRQKTLDRAELLRGNGHFSPFEHVARPMDRGERDAVEAQVDAIRQVGEVRSLGDLTIERMIDEAQFSGNLRGWVQMRAEVPHQSNFQKALDAQGSDA